MNHNKQDSNNKVLKTQDSLFGNAAAKYDNSASSPPLTGNDMLHYFGRGQHNAEQ
jgi:hypothetical protein